MNKIEIKHCENCKGAGKYTGAGLVPQYPKNCIRCNGTGHIVIIDGNEQL